MTPLASTNSAATHDPSPLPAQDDDATGIEDPFLELQAEPDDSVDQTMADGPAAEVPIGLPKDPRDVNSAGEDALGPDFAELYSFDDDRYHLSDVDDAQGPNGQFEWGALDITAGMEPDDANDGPMETNTIELAPLQPLSGDESLDEEPLSTVPLPGLQIDDIELAWSKEPWTECALNVAISPRRTLALVGTTLCVGGESTHLVNTRLLTSTQDIPLSARTRRAFWLDIEANRLLLLTTTGQLFLWRRGNDTSGTTRRVTVPNTEVVSMIWQLAPGVPSLLLRLESGRLLTWDDATETLSPSNTSRSTRRLRALSDIGEPRVSLWQDRNHTRLVVELQTSEQRLDLTSDMERAVSDSIPMLAGFIDYVLLGVRDHGLFLRSPGSSDFTLIPGCRRLTAITVGLVQGRPMAFVGLFSELDDRADIVLLDLLTKRASRVAELNVLTDDSGPADDPPERARIDTMLWDPNLARLWVAGCFGLTCFSPPTASIAG